MKDKGGNDVGYLGRFCGLVQLGLIMEADSMQAVGSWLDDTY